MAEETQGDLYSSNGSSTPQTSEPSSPAPSSPGPPAGGGNEGTPLAAAAPVSPTGQSTQQADASQAQAQANWTSIREAAYKQYGIDLRHMPDDQAALQHLIGQAVQARQQQQYAQRYLQHANQFEQWLTSQQQPQAAKPAGWWNPPEFNPAWKSLISRDPDTGEYKLAPGAPPEALPKYLAYEQYRRDFVDRFTTDPAATLRPMIEEVAQQIAQVQIQANLSSYQDQVFADSYVAQNSGWLHQRDPQTQGVVNDPFTGRPLLSPAGQRFKSYVEQLHAGGVQDLRQQERLARALVERDLAVGLLQQQQVGAQNQQLKNQFLQNNNLRQPNQSGVLAPGAGLPPDNARLSLADRLAQRFREAGVTDTDFAANTR